MQAVPIYKKGDTDEPSNYRPVSLLNSSLDFTWFWSGNAYKLFWRIPWLRHNLGLDLLGALHALFLTRRMQDIAEQQGSNLIITFLGWEKASHKVQHEKQHVALRRFGVHQHFIDVIKRKLIPTFASLSKMNLVHPQQNGRRQGLGKAVHYPSTFLCWVWV